MSKVTITIEDVINNNDKSIGIDFYCDVFGDQENSSAVAIAGAMSAFAKRLIDVSEEDFKNITTETEH